MRKYLSGRGKFPTTILIVIVLSLAVVMTVFAATYNLETAGSSVDIDGTLILQFDPTSSAGGGNFNRYLVIQKVGTEQGYNTNGSWEFNEKTGTTAITLSGTPQTVVSGVLYREFQLDLNESTSTPLISMDALQFFTASTDNLTGYNAAGPDIGGATDLIWDMDAIEDNTILMDYSLQSGSGEADYLVLVPESKFQSQSSCYATPDTCYIYLYSHFGGYGGSYTSDSGAEEWGLATGGARFNPAIDIEKTTNGWENDVDPVHIMEGTAITWEYTITNTGDVDLVNVVVTDNQIGTICTIPSLPIGVVEVCYAYGTATLGLYQNIGTATGEFSSIPVTDEDPSSYLGVEHTAVTVSSIGLTIQPAKSVNISWKTETEMTTIGFNLYRSWSPDSDLLGNPINPELKKSENPGDIIGNSYIFIDAEINSNTQYYYWLEEVQVDGTSSLYGPFGLVTGMQYLPLIGK